MADPQSLNRYGYAQNDPVNYEASSTVYRKGKTTGGSTSGSLKYLPDGSLVLIKLLRARAR